MTNKGLFIFKEATPAPSNGLVSSVANRWRFSNLFPPKLCNLFFKNWAGEFSSRNRRLSTAALVPADELRMSGPNRRKRIPGNRKFDSFGAGTGDSSWACDRCDTGSTTSRRASASRRGWPASRSAGSVACTRNSPAGSQRIIHQQPVDVNFSNKSLTPKSPWWDLFGFNSV